MARTGIELAADKKFTSHNARARKMVPDISMVQPFHSTDGFYWMFCFSFQLAPRYIRSTHELAWQSNRIICMLHFALFRVVCLLHRCFSVSDNINDLKPSKIALNMLFALIAVFKRNIYRDRQIIRRKRAAFSHGHELAWLFESSVIVAELFGAMHFRLCSEWNIYLAQKKQNNWKAKSPCISCWHWLLFSREIHIYRGRHIIRRKRTEKEHKLRSRFAELKSGIFPQTWVGVHVREFCYCCRTVWSHAFNMDQYPMRQNGGITETQTITNN